jgi:hypothetical protein
VIIVHEKLRYEATTSSISVVFQTRSNLMAVDTTLVVSTEADVRRLMHHILEVVQC